MICTCRDPMALGTVHRADAPCYIPETREWVGLTDEGIKAVIATIDPDEQYLPAALRQFARAIEAKLKEKNT